MGLEVARCYGGLENRVCLKWPSSILYRPAMETSCCTYCLQVKPVSEFSFRNLKRQIKHRHCKKCQKDVNKKFYTDNPQRVEEIKRKQQELRAIVIRLKSEPCLDCGVSYNWWQMDFDHRPGETKTQMVSKMIKHGISEAALRNEIAKCDLVCANCHRNRTYLRFRNER